MLHAWLLILLPLTSAAVLAFRGRRMDEAAVGRLACGAVGLSFAVAVLVFFQLLGARGEATAAAPFTGLTVGGPTWMTVGKLHLSFHLLLDPLSVVMALVVTGVGWAIHLYSRGYMHGDPHFPRFFALLNLFIGNMLVLVLADNLAMTFIGWEGVGFCSYMLIGFYTERESATRAGKKAFIVNRVGDLGFLLGLFLTYQYLGTVGYREVALAAPKVLPTLPGAAAAIGLLLFIGACGKSAQFPLHVWLPDAMEGPTPVSALIHAATMVTAGVFLVVRMGAVYAFAPEVLTLVAVVGLITAFLGATMAVVQTDIKKVLAYSTISQLGYMFLACGVGAYSAAIFHLVTHAFFKGLLFLGSGSVIHAVEHAFHGAGEHGDPQDMRGMGGLSKKLHTTHWTMAVGSAALAGLPGLAGFFSKDEILYFAGRGLGNGVFWLVGVLIAMLTAVYMTRLMCKTFWQTTRLSEAAYHHLEESPKVLTQPLVALALLSIFGGLLNLPGVGLLEGASQGLARWLGPVTAAADLTLFRGEPPHDPGAEVFGLVLSGLLALAAVGLGWWLYRVADGLPSRLAERLAGLHRTLRKLYYVDAFYQGAIVQPGHRLAEWLSATVDARGIDGCVNGVATVVGGLSERLRGYQPGFVRSYAQWFAVGAVGVVAWMATREAPGWVGAVVVALALVLVLALGVVARPRNEG